MRKIPKAQLARMTERQRFLYDAEQALIRAARRVNKTGGLIALAGNYFGDGAELTAEDGITKATKELEHVIRYLRSNRWRKRKR